MHDSFGSNKQKKSTSSLLKKMTTTTHTHTHTMKLEIEESKGREYQRTTFLPSSNVLYPLNPIPMRI
jgi:hypothetical protein